MPSKWRETILILSRLTTTYQNYDNRELYKLPALIGICHIRKNACFFFSVRVRKVARKVQSIRRDYSLPNIQFR